MPDISIADAATEIPNPPPRPEWRKPPKDWEHRVLYDRVIDALYALPGLFENSLNISGIRVTDLHTLNNALGASIEQSVVDNLNELRKIWDPDNDYQLYSFVRQPQTFPDVRLQTDAPGEPDGILLGIELKGWFALAKEGEPSFRYKATPNACADADLLVVFPWVLSEVISGVPRLLKPLVTGARYAAEFRNYYWTFLRGVTGRNAEIVPAPHQAPYPKKSDNYSDVPVSDRGKNFGRVARGQFMREFVDEVMAHLAAGIPLGAWHKFFKAFTESFDKDSVERQIELIEAAFREEVLALGGDENERLTEIRQAISSVVRAVQR